MEDGWEEDKEEEEGGKDVWEDKEGEEGRKEVEDERIKRRKGEVGRGG